MKKLIYRIYNTLFKRKEILNKIDLFKDSKFNYFLELNKHYSNGDLKNFEKALQKYYEYDFLIKENYSKLIF